MKRCAKCEQTKPRAEFSKNKRLADGLWCYCKQCDRKRMAERRAADPERVREIMRRSVEKNRDAINARKRARRAADPEGTKTQRKADYAKYREQELATMRAWKAANREHMQQQQAAKYWADPASARAKQNAYRAKFPHLARAWRMARIAAGKRATPVWSDGSRIKLAYEAADLLMQVTGEWYEVDHIVPLRGAIARKHVVCGLHVDYNLQVIPRSENRTKSNVMWPDMPGNQGE